MTLTMELKEQWREGRKEGIKEASAKYISLMPPAPLGRGIIKNEFSEAP